MFPGNRLCATLLFVPALLWAAESGTRQEIDVQKSAMTVRVFKAGLFSAFGHDHEISAPIRQGGFSESSSSADLIVDAGEMRVLDKDVSAKDRAEIQETMLGPKVLDSVRFPEIRFRSTAVEHTGTGRLAVHGDLTLHGQTRPVKLDVQAGNGHYKGATQLKQSDFGIQPVTAGGGAIKVKDELTVEFDIVAKP